jgi:hypothetical protein
MVDGLTNMTKHHPAIVAAILIFLLGTGLVWAQFYWWSDKARKTFSSPDKHSRQESWNDVLTVEQISSSIRIPFTLTEANNISVPVVINGTESLELMFHSAVDSISLTTEAVKKMRTLTISESVNVESWGGVAQAGVSTGNRLQIGNLGWKDQTIYIDGLSGPGTDGKFGRNLFTGKILEINFDTRELGIHVSVPKAVTEATSTYQRLDFLLLQESMYVVGELTVGDNTFTNQFMIHSGFGGTALLDDAFVSTHQLASKLDTISERELKDSFGNVLRTRKVKLPMLSFAGVHFSDVPIEIFDGTLGNQKVSVLGGDLLKRFNLIVDSANQHLYLAPNAFYGVAFSN